jgi:hypothetical protein
MDRKIRRATTALTVLGTMLLSSMGVKSVVGAGKVTTLSVPDAGPVVAARIDAGGTIHLVYNSGDGPQYVQSTDRGKTFLKPISVLDRESRKPGLAFDACDLALEADGRVHVAMSTNAWKLKLPQEEWGFFYANLEPGARAFSPVRNINRKPSEGFSLAADDKGNVTACWLSDKLYANVSHDHGKTFSPTVEIDHSFNPCNCCTTSTAYGADGRLAVLYREETNNERDMYLVLWDQPRNEVSRTRVSGTGWKIDACPMSYYAIVPRDDGYVAVWPTQGQIYFARLDGNGALVSPSEITTPGTMGMRSGMLAWNGPDGTTLVAWKKDNQLGWQSYDKQGRPVGRPGVAKGAGNNVAGVLDKSGDFLLFP